MEQEEREAKGKAREQRHLRITRMVLLLSLTLFLGGVVSLMSTPLDADEIPPPGEVAADAIILVLPCVWIVLLSGSRLDTRAQRALDTAFIIIYTSALLDLANDFLSLPGFLEQFREAAMPVGMIAATVGLARWIKHQELTRNQLREQEERLVALSITDELSGLFNSRYFFQRIPQEIDRSLRYSRPLSLLFLDIDNFKRFNDEHGHVEGDKVIRELGHTIHTLLRGNDIAFRYGGEEFVILLPETQERGAALVADRIRHAFSEHTFNPTDGSGPLHCTVSVGVAELEPGERPKAFIRRADQALYQAKAKGKNQVFRFSFFDS